MSVLIQQFLRHSEHLYPDAIAIDDGVEQLNYTQLVTRVESLCDLFIQHGLKPGQHLAVFSTNNADYVAIYFACAHLGLVIVPMNAHLKEEEIQWILEDCSPAAVVVEASYLGTFSRALRATGFANILRFAQGARHSDWIALSNIQADKQPGSSGQIQYETRVNASTEPDAIAKAGDLAIQMYTSGTTGRPKGVMLSHDNMTSLVVSWLHEMPLVAHESRFMQATPLFHVGGLLVCLSTIAAGATLILLPKFEPELACETLIEKSITDTLLVPAMIQRLLSLPHIGRLEFSHLTTMVYGASLMPTSVLRHAHQIFSCQFLQGYGLTETSGVALSLKPEDHDFSASGDKAERLAAAGRELSCCEVRIVDGNTESVAAGVIGEIAVRGSNVMLGYWNNPEATAETIVDGWLRTGDLGRADNDGYIYVVGRSKDMIDFSGENVYPAEVENVLSEHPRVAEVAVIGLPHQSTGEQVVAVIVARESDCENDKDPPGASLSLADELVGFIRERLADFKCPTRFIVTDTLPRTPAGKIQKQVLRDRYT